MTTIKRRSRSSVTKLIYGPLFTALFLLQPVTVNAQWTTPDASQNINNTNSGNVGIGTTTPTALLEVKKSQSAGTTVIVDNPFTTAGNGAYSGFFLKQAGANRLLIASVNDNHNSITPGTAQFWNFANAPTVFATNATERMRITATGNVGIGTSTPDATLAVSSNIGDGYYAASISNANIYGYGMRINTAHGSLDTTRPTLSVENNGIPILQVLGAGPTSLFGNGDQYAAFIKNTGTYGFGLRITSGPSTNGRTALLVENASSTSLLQVQNNGNVGIGITVPTFKLHVQGGNVNADGLCIAGDCRTAWSQVGGAGSSQWASGTNNISYNAGSVGIGISAPTFKLDVRGGNVNSDGLCIAGDCKTAWSQVTGTSQWTTASGPSIHYTDGNVGIGTTSPTQGKLMVAQSSSPTNFANKGIVASVSGGIATANAINSSLSMYDSTAIHAGDVGILYSGSTYKMVLSVNDDTSGSPGNVMTLQGGGNVGIGTTSPQRSMTLYKSSGPVLQLVDNASGTTANDGFLLVQDGLNSYLENSEAGSVNFRTSATTRMTINSAGDVGIGLTSPAAKLDINGNTKINGNIELTGTGNITAAGTIEAGNIKAKYQDVAEWVPSTHALPAGTVVTLDPTKSNHVEASSKAYDTRVAGVISAQPGIALGEQGDNKVLVATTGRVVLTVDASKGPIQIGDLLVTSDIPGVAMKSQAINVGGVQIHRPGTLVGKALEPLAKGQGKILVLLSLQ